MAPRTKQKQRRVDALDIAHQILEQDVWNGNIAAAAKRRGYTEDDAQRIARQVEKIARRLFKQALAIPFPEYEESVQQEG